MSANSGLSLGDLFNTLTSSNALKYAGNYGTGNKILDFARPVLDTLTGAYAAYQANPNGGGTLLPGLANAISGMSQRNYLGQLQQQQVAKMALDQMKNENNAGLLYQQSGYKVANPEAGFDLDFANNTAKAVRDRVGNAGMITGMQTGDWSGLNPDGNYDSFFGKVLDHHFNVLDADATGANISDFVTNNYGRPGATTVAPTRAVPAGQPQLEPMQTPTFSTGINTTAPAPQRPMLAPLSSLNQGAVDWSTLQSMRKGEQDNNNTQFSNQTNRQHYERSDKTDQFKAQTDRNTSDNQIKNNYWKRPPSGGGGSINETEATLGLAKELGLTPAQTVQLLNDPSNFDYDAIGQTGTAGLDPAVVQGIKTKMMIDPVGQIQAIMQRTGDMGVNRINSDGFAAWRSKRNP